MWYNNYEKAFENDDTMSEMACSSNRAQKTPVTSSSEGIRSEPSQSVIGYRNFLHEPGKSTQSCSSRTTTSTWSTMFEGTSALPSNPWQGTSEDSKTQATVSSKPVLGFSDLPPSLKLVRISEPTASSVIQSNTVSASSLYSGFWTGNNETQLFMNNDDVKLPVNDVFTPLSDEISEQENHHVQNLCRLFELQARRRHRAQQCMQKTCNFCKRNGEPFNVYMSHNLHENGRVVCPILRRYICPLCGSTGDQAHTISYCPLSNGSSVMEATRTNRKSCGCERNCKHGIQRHH